MVSPVKVVAAKMQRASCVGKGRRAEEPDNPGKPSNRCRSGVF